MSTSATITVAHFSDSEAFGGTERALLQLVAGLDRARWRPVLLHADAAGARQLAEEAAAIGVPVHPVPRATSAVRGVTSMPSIARTLRRERATIFHAHQTWSLSCRYGIVAAALARVPVRVATAQLFLEMPRLTAIDLQHALISRCLDRHIAVSQFVAGRLRERFGVPPERIAVIPNAVQLRSHAPRDASLRAELAGDETTPLVLTVARLEAQKGLPFLLEAAAAVRDAVFVVAGDGPDRAALEAQAAALGVHDRVRFLGHRRDVPALLAVADVFVLPSLTEGFPLSVLEAMHAGVPVVATAAGGTGEIVADGVTGVLVPTADAPALATGIRSLLDDRARAERLAEAARRVVEDRHTTEAMVSATSALYESLLPR